MRNAVRAMKPDEDLPRRQALDRGRMIDTREAAKLLGIPENVMQCGLLPVAYTKGVDFKPARRPGPEEITFWDHWS